jgi:hypothetical protein
MFVSASLSARDAKQGYNRLVVVVVLVFARVAMQLNASNY